MTQPEPFDVTVIHNGRQWFAWCRQRPALYYKGRTMAEAFGNAVCPLLPALAVQASFYWSGGVRTLPAPLGVGAEHADQIIANMDVVCPLPLHRLIKQMKIAAAAPTPMKEAA